MWDDPLPNRRPSLLKELTDGSAGVWARLAVTLALAAVAAAGALLGAIFLAALNPAWNYYNGGYGVRPRDELMVTMIVSDQMISDRTPRISPRCATLP